MAFIFFILGLFFGSFLNVLIDRLPQGENPWRGRSRCDYCKKTLGVWDLLPVISFLWLRGKCRYCHKRLSWEYPLLELFTASVFGICGLALLNHYINHPYLGLILTAGLIIASSFIVIFFADIKYQIIPDEMIISLLGGSLLFIVFTSRSLLPYLLTSLIAAGFFLAIYVVTRGRGMGFGDVKLVFALGLFLGFPKALIALYIAFLTGAVVSLILILVKKKRLKSRIAFGPFLVGGSVLSLIFGQYIAQWYLNFFK